VRRREPEAGRIGVNWGSLDQSLLTRMMDENSRLAQPMRHARLMEAMCGARWTPPPLQNTTGLRSDRYFVGQGERGARPDRRVHQSCCALHVSTASGADRGGDGHEGLIASTADLRRCCLRDWRYDSREPDAEAGGDGRKRCWPRSRFCSRWGFAASCPGNELSGVRQDDEHLLQELAEQIQSYLAVRCEWRSSIRRGRAEAGGDGCVVTGRAIEAR